MFGFKMPINPVPSIQISTAGWLQGLSHLSKKTVSDDDDDDRSKTEMIYSRLKHTNIPQDPSGPHTETQNRPFIKPIQAAQTRLEAFGL